ncbi:MAG TPA: ATP-binding cassette domain-containing protein [Candidatus Nitrosotalea sp.]|nr:ATP-binding cassette domain-containing protein [Candidatus Nitrosotalea sp.]
MKILEVVGLTCRVGAVTLLDALSFTIEEGEILALCGPAGSGKTAAVHGLSGGVPAESGRLIFDGREVTGLRPRELAQQGLVRGGLVPSPRWSVTIAEIVALAVLWPRLGLVASLTAKWPDARVRSRVAALLERVGLSAHARRRHADLSLIDLARLRLAQALALRPRLLLLDEPLGVLPPDDRPAIAALISEIRAFGATVLVTEREPAVAKTVADRVAVLARGALVA